MKILNKSCKFAKLTNQRKQRCYLLEGLKLHELLQKAIGVGFKYRYTDI